MTKLPLRPISTTRIHKGVQVRITVQEETRGAWSSSYEVANGPSGTNPEMSPNANAAFDAAFARACALLDAPIE